MNTTLCQRLGSHYRSDGAMFGRTSPHELDRALVRSAKVVSEPILLRTALENDPKDEATREAASCWWRSTRNDPQFPGSANHVKVYFRFKRRIDATMVPEPHEHD